MYTKATEPTGLHRDRSDRDEAVGLTWFDILVVRRNVFWKSMG